MSTRNFFIALMIGLFAACGAVAQTPLATGAQPAASPQTASAVPGGIGDITSSEYVLGRDDVIEVGLLGRNDFGGRVRVQADGTIQLPFVGKLNVADRNTSEVAELIRKALQTGGYFADPVVTVEVVGYASRYIVVLGAVGSQGLVPINRPYRMSEILAKVGGVRDGSADYMVVRSADGTETRLSIQDLSMGDASKDPYVKAGDKIFVPLAETYYIYGGVNAPGAYPLKAGLTVEVAIVKAGGLAENGSGKKVETTRAGKKVKLTSASTIEAGDVIKVGEKLF